nr:MAG TPA: hypothetical protein [Bacteriophage sp.]
MERFCSITKSRVVFSKVEENLERATHFFIISHY